MAVGTAWARVEAGVHYPACVLGGLALGNFVGTFMSRYFIGDGTSVKVAIVPIKDNYNLAMTYNF